MINILENLELQYLQTPANAFSKEEAKLSILEAEKTSDNYRMLVKHSTNESLDEIAALQERILDGFNFAMSQLFNIVNESNYEEISRLVRFLKNKLQMNMWIVENEKRKFYFKNLPENNLPKENSLFVEVFFVQKFEEITGKKLVRKNN